MTTTHTPTPQTDSKVIRVPTVNGRGLANFSSAIEMVPADFARKLEKNNNALVASIKELLGWAKSVEGQEVSVNLTEGGEIFKEARALLAKVGE